MKNLYLLLFVFLYQVLPSQEAFNFRNYQVTINVSENGSMRVTEDMDVNFTEKRRGIIHRLPYKYQVNERPYTTTITDIEVSGGPVKITRESRHISLRIGDPNKYIIGSQDYKVEYTVSGAIANYETHDEFYWNVIGFETDAVTDQASFSIRFPLAWADSLYDYVSYSGLAGSTTSEIYLSKNGAQFSGAVTEPLQQREGITLAVKIPKGLIQYPASNPINTSSPTQNMQQTPFWKKWLLAIPLGMAGFLFYLFSLLGRQKDRIPATLKYYPPEDLTPAEVGTFYDYKVNRRDIISLLPFWGEMGFVKIKPIEGDEADLSFHKMKDISDDRPSYEKKFFNDLFKDGNTILLSDLRNSFYKTMHTVSKEIKKEVEDLNLYDQNSMTTSTILKIIFSGIGMIVIGILFLVMLEVILVGVLIIVLGIITMLFAFKKKKFSELGTETHRHLVGLRNWLKDPDPTKLNEILEKNPLYLSQIFPYVLAFGLDKSWEKRFDDLEVPPPIWYDYHNIHGHHKNYNYGQFTKDFQPHKIEQVFYSTPAPPPGSSSGGSFSSGGGFSGSAGGGFGGSSTSSW